MKRRLLALFLAAAMLLSGCSLAVEAVDMDGVPYNDQLVGMFVTVSMEENGTLTNIWDEEAAGMEPLHLFGSEGKRLYAKQTEMEIDSFDGILTTEHPYLFPEDCGLLCMMFYEDIDGEGVWQNVTDAEFSDNTKHRTNTNGRTSLEIETTIYVSDTATDLTLSMNPVYQTPEGEVYALGTAPGSFHAVSMYGCSTGLTQETLITLGDGEKTSGGSIKLNFETVTLPQAYVILELDENDQVLRRSTFAPDQMPETFTPGEGTEYLILECEKGADTVRRVYSPADESSVMDTFYPGRYGICVKGYTRIDWEGVQ